MLVAEVTEQGVLAGEVCGHSLTAGMDIMIPPCHAHTFYLEKDTKLLCLLPGLFTPDNPECRHARWLVDGLRFAPYGRN